MRRLLGAALLAALTATGAAGAATVVKVDLGDAADDKSMAMKLDKSSVKAGQVRFDVHNLAKFKVHEMLVVAVKSKDEALPVDKEHDIVDEGHIAKLGEASDLDGGKSKSLSLRLKAGHYLLICNQEGHYSHGMKANFEVTP